MAEERTHLRPANAIHRVKTAGRPENNVQNFNLADVDGSLRYATGRNRWTAMNGIAAVTRLFNPLLASWLVALSGGRLSALPGRLLRLRRLAGSMLHGELAPPAPVRLQVETTDVCNLRCIHCKRERMDDMNTLTMPLDHFVRVVTDTEPLFANLAGFGEPLIDRTIFAKLAFLHRRGIRTSVPTNGTYIRRNKCEQLAAELPDILQLSLDGATKESFEAIRKLGDFDKIVANYQAICNARAEGRTRPHTVIRLFCALQRHNLHDYRAMYRLTKTLKGLDSFGLVPVSYGSANNAQVPTKDEILALHRDLEVAIAETSDEDEKKFYRQWRRVSAEWIKPKGVERMGLEANSAPCVIPWFSSYIDAKGRVYPCCFLPNTKHVMGTLREDGSGFAEIWQGERYRAFRADLMSARAGLEGCRGCPRNDTRVMATLNKIRPLLPGAQRALVPAQIALGAVSDVTP